MTSLNNTEKIKKIDSNGLESSTIYKVDKMTPLGTKLLHWSFKEQILLKSKTYLLFSQRNQTNLEE